MRLTPWVLHPRTRGQKWTPIPPWTTPAIFREALHEVREIAKWHNEAEWLEVQRIVNGALDEANRREMLKR
jgi:hypothetical protein